MEPLEAFFRQYTWFEYRRYESAKAQFDRLRRQAGWERGNPKSDEAWERYRTALVRQFNSSFSKDDENLAAWHALLQHIGITNPPATVKECKKLINGKYINLVDLIDARHDPTIVIVHFPTESALSAYTRNEGKYFPQGHLEAGSLLRYLLRHILNPDPNRRDPTQTDHQRKRKKRHTRR